MSNRLTNEQINQIEELLFKGKSHRKIASIVLGRESRKSTVSDYVKRKQFTGVIPTLETLVIKKPKIFVVDIETSAEIVYSFRRFKAFISPDQVIQRSYMLSYSAVSLDSDEVISRNLTSYPYFDEDHTSDFFLVSELWNFLDEVDIIIAHNGYKFDRAYINQRFAYYDMPPTSPYKVIDTLKTAKAQFNLPANSLKELGLYYETEAKKQDNSGFDLWKRCMAGDRSAFKEMQEYNDWDVLSLRDLYWKLRAWIYGHPDVSNYYEDDKQRCVRCGHTELELLEDKFYHTQVSAFTVLRCTSCGGLVRGRKNQKSKSKMLVTGIAIQN